MLVLPQPSFGPTEIYDATVATIHNANDRARFGAESSNVAVADASFAAAFSSNNAHRVPLSMSGLSSVSTAEMRRLYLYRLRGKKYATRDYYDAIMLSAEDDICPYCGERRVGTIDHYLPQVSFSALSVSPINLIPCCSDCNRLKKDYKPSAVDPALLHPYFDSVDQFDWLIIRFQFIRSRIPKVIYDVDQSALPAALASRVQAQFEMLRIGQLYRSHAGQKLRGLARRLPGVAAAGGERAVVRHLLEAESNCDYGWRNSWERVLFAALAGNNDFCNSRV